MLLPFKEKVDRRLLQLPPDQDPSRLTSIAETSVRCCPKGTNSKTFYISTRYRGGWSPQVLADLAALSVIAQMRRHSAGENRRLRWLTSMNIATVIKVLAEEREKKLRKIPWENSAEHIHAFEWCQGPHHWKLLSFVEYGQHTAKLRDPVLLHRSVSISLPTPTLLPSPPPRPL